MQTLKTESTILPIEVTRSILGCLRCRTERRAAVTGPGTTQYCETPKRRRPCKSKTHPEIRQTVIG